MDLMARRRGITASDSGVYVRSGLVLWMDGIDKGTTAGAWTDRVSGHVFTNVNGMESGQNYVGLSADRSQYFVNTTFNVPSGIWNTTLEVVISDYAPAMMVFIAQPKKMCFGIRGTGDQIMTGTGDTNGPVITYTNGSKIFSINGDGAYVDGIPVTISGDGLFAGADSNAYIGRRSTGYYYSGKIYAIRLYSRKLSSAEMLHNQRIDNKRFGLGLTI